MFAVRKHREEGSQVRVHSCPFCGFTADRDVNAAKNILRRALTEISRMDRPSQSLS